MDLKQLNKIIKKFTYPPQNWERIKYLWQKDEQITFYSWECPPRQIQYDSEGERWVNFDIDIDLVVNGKKLDKYTELPRLTTQPEKEKWFINTIIEANPKATYIKLIADTNGLYLYKRSREILGDKKIKDLAQKFQSLLILKANVLLPTNSPKIVLYSSLQKNFRPEYEMFFNLVFRGFDKKESELVSNNIINYWADRINYHVGLTKKDRSEREDLLKRIIASYAAEGMLFQLFSQSGIMSNPVWVNWEERPESSRTTEILRERYGIMKLPTIYFVE